MSSVQLRKEKIIDPSIDQFTWDEFDTVCLSDASLVRHMKSHIGKPLTNYDQYYSKKNLWSVCQKTCRNRFGLTCYMKTDEQPEQSLQNPPGPLRSNLVCRVCNKY